MVAATVFSNLPVALADGVTAGTPYQAGGTYDATVPHVVINQIYGGYNASKDQIVAGTDSVVFKDKGQACSHSFIELYNPTDSDVSLTGWSVQVSTSAYYNSNQPISTQNGKWAMLPLTGTIRAHSSYLVRAGATGSSAPFLTVSNRDQDWAMPLCSKGLSVALMSNAATLTANVSPFDNTTHAPTNSTYVDMLSTSGNDTTPDERVFAYEGSYTWSGSKQKAIRRMAFADSDHNATVDDAPYGVISDAQVIGYNTTDATYKVWARPRYSGDGVWSATPMPPAVESTVLSTTTPNCLTNAFGADPKTTRTFTWQMPSSAPTGAVEISTASDLSSPKTLGATVSIADAGVASTFRVSATGLSAGTTYYYRTDNGAAQGPTYSFTTEGANDSSFSFLHVSDTQADVDTYTVPTILDFQTWGRAVGAATAAYHPNFLFETGDIVDLGNAEDQWRWYFKEAQSVLGGTALLAGVGNHDQTAVYPATAFREHFTMPNQCTDPAVTPGTVYSFDYGNAHFVMLNTENKGAGFTAQYNWADADMAATHKKFIIVGLHRGMYEGTGLADTYDAFGGLLDKYKVDLVLQGHEHAYYRTQAMKNGVVTTTGDGTVSLETGGSGSKQDSAPPFQSYMAVDTAPGAPTYSVITVTDHNIDVHTVVVQNPNTTPTIVPLQSAGVTLTPSGSTVDFDIMAAPAGLAPVAPTVAGGSDGQITGTTSAMEYKLAAGDTWTSCTGPAVSGLAPGAYSVRYKAVHDSDTLRVTTVTVDPRVSPSFSNRIAYAMPGLATTSFRGTFDRGGKATLKVSTSRGTKKLFSGVISPSAAVQTLATWDGTVGGKQLPADNCRWTLTVKDGSGRTTTYTGVVAVGKRYYSFSGTGTGSVSHYPASLGKGACKVKISASSASSGATIGLKLSGPAKLAAWAYSVPDAPKSLSKTLALSGKSAIRAAGAHDIAVTATAGVKYTVTIVQ
jgi:hypothetical protein